MQKIPRALRRAGAVRRLCGAVKQHTLIFLGMAAGAGFGLLLNGQEGEWARDVLWWSDLFGKVVFIGALKMIVAPLIFFSILAGILSLPTKGELWQIGWRTLVFYVITTSIAVTIGLFLVLTIQPGHRGAREELRGKAQTGQLAGEEYRSKEERMKQAPKSPREAVRTNLEEVIQNPFFSLTNAKSLGIIFFAILLGIALVATGEQAKPVAPVIDGVNAAIMKLTGWIMWAAPFFIFCLVTALVGTQGPDLFETLFWYVLTVLAGIAGHVVVLLLIVRFAGGLSPWRFLAGIRRAWLVAFATRSSAATLPITMECARDELKVPRKVSDFVLPLGATINMDGTALYEGVAVIFLIQLFGGLPGTPENVTAVMTGIIFVTAVLASIGAAAVPDAGLITMILVANAVGLDEAYIALIFAVDAFLDMFRTSTNVMGDSVGSVVVARFHAKDAPA